MEYERHPVSALFPDMSIEEFDVLKEKALSHWKAAHEHAAMAVGEAWECGAALATVKANLEYGEWLPWLRKNGIEHTKAKRWMQLSRALPVHEAVELGSVDAALKHIASNKAPTPEPTSNGATCTISPDTGESAHTDVTAESSQTNQGWQPEHAAGATPQEPPTEQAPPAKTYGQLQKENAALEQRSILQQQQVNALQHELEAAKVRIEAHDLDRKPPSQQGARLTELKEEIKIHHAAANKWQQYCLDERRDRKRFQAQLKKANAEIERAHAEIERLKADLAELR